MIIIIDAVELFDADSELLDNMTVSFETLDTCFCYGHCGCAVSYSSTKFILNNRLCLINFAYSVVMIRPTALPLRPWLTAPAVIYGSGACLDG